MSRVGRKKIAVVQCNGKNCRQYTGAMFEGKDCGQILETNEDGMSCQYGCLGGGSCVKVCRFQAIYINEGGTAQVDAKKCVGCGMCAKVCPRKLIRISTPEYNIYPACLSQDAGAATRKNCDTGCVACGVCVRACPLGAITIEDNHAVIDEEKCVACGMCAVKCPRGTIRDYNGIFTIQKAQVES